jgi:hypothetical protein
LGFAGVRHGTCGQCKVGQSALWRCRAVSQPDFAGAAICARVTLPA